MNKKIFNKKTHAYLGYLLKRNFLDNDCFSTHYLSTEE